MKEGMLGYSVQSESIHDFARHVCTEVFEVNRNSNIALWLACLNPHSYVIARSDYAFYEALHDADWLIPDGVGIVLASYLLGGNINARITGSDVFDFIHQYMNNHPGYSVFFLGSTDDTLSRICSSMSLDYPNIRIAGTYSPPFKQCWSQDDIDAMVTAVNLANPDVLWVGMTAPKQEKLVHQCLSRLNVRLAVPVGAVFDFYGGNVTRSHPIFQRMGLEWMPRLFQQPRRLWKRTIVSAPLFLWYVLREKISGK